MRCAAWASLVAGLWLIVAPFATGYYTISSIATTEAIAVGSLISTFALWSAWAGRVPHYVDYALMLFGAWSIIAPFVLECRELELAFYSDVTVGIVVFLIAIVPALSGTRTLHPKAA